MLAWVSVAASAWLLANIGSACRLMFAICRSRELEASPVALLLARPCLACVARWSFVTCRCRAVVEVATA